MKHVAASETDLEMRGEECFPDLDEVKQTSNRNMGHYLPGVLGLIHEM